MTREETAREAARMSLDNLVVWATAQNDNPYRLTVVNLEIQKRVAKAQIASARYMLLSVIAALASAVVGLLAFHH